MISGGGWGGLGISNPEDIGCEPNCHHIHLEKVAGEVLVYTLEHLVSLVELYDQEQDFGS